jgi:hypothetical protein
VSGIYPAFDRELPGVDGTEVVGKGLSRDGDRLDSITDRLGIKSLYAFIDAYTMTREVIGANDPIPDGVPPVQWYAAEEGLNIVSRLKSYLHEHATEVNDYEAVTHDLQDLENVLTIAKQHDARFHLLVDL